MAPVKADLAYYALAQRLSDLGVAQYRKTGTYAEDPTKPAVVLGPLTQSPTTVLGLWLYNWDTSRDAHNPDLYFQLRFRAAGSILAVERLSDNVFGKLHWSDDHDSETWPGGVRVLHSVRVVRTPAEPNPNKQFELTDSYRLTLNPGDDA